MLLVPGDRQLEQISFAPEQITAPRRVRADEVVERRAASVEVKAILRDSITMAGGSKFRGRNGIDASTRSRHRGLRISFGDGGVTGAAGCAANECGCGK